jgi:hypothetical protein
MEVLAEKGLPYRADSAGAMKETGLAGAMGADSVTPERAQGPKAERK